MLRINRRDLICCILCMAGPFFVMPAWAERDHDRARLAVERGEALPLVAILERMGSDLGGEVIDVSFEQKRGRWMYEFKVVRPGGTLVEIYVDAASGEILKQEEKH